MPDTECFRNRVAAAIGGDAWVSEGNYREAFDLRLPHADTVIIVERRRCLLLARILRCLLSPVARPGLPEGCPKHLDWKLLGLIWRFQKVTWPRIEPTRILYGPDVPMIRLRSNREAAAFLTSLHAAGETTDDSMTGQHHSV